MSDVKIDGKVIPGFETRPAWKTPIFCEPMKDAFDDPVGTRLSIGILIPTIDDSVKYKLMDAMDDAIKNVLKQEGLIK